MAFKSVNAIKHFLLEMFGYNGRIWEICHIIEQMPEFMLVLQPGSSERISDTIANGQLKHKTMTYRPK